MLAKFSQNEKKQKNLFYGSLFDMLDMSDSLIVLVNTIDWSMFEK